MPCILVWVGANMGRPPIRSTVFDSFKAGSKAALTLQFLGAVHAARMLLQAMLARDDVRFRMMAASLQLAGHGEAARQLLGGWSLWKLYNTSAMDFHLFFCARNLMRLQALLQPLRCTSPHAQGSVHALLL